MSNRGIPSEIFLRRFCITIICVAIYSATLFGLGIYYQDSYKANNSIFMTNTKNLSLNFTIEINQTGNYMFAISIFHHKTENAKGNIQLYLENVLEKNNQTILFTTNFTYYQFIQENLNQSQTIRIIGLIYEGRSWEFYIFLNPNDQKKIESFTTGKFEMILFSIGIFTTIPIISISLFRKGRIADNV